MGLFSDFEEYFFAVDAGGGALLGALLGQRVGEADTRNEEEQREDGVVLSQSVPFHVAHVSDYGVGKLAGPDSADCRYQRCHAHDEQHVEAPEGVERHQTPVIVRFHDILIGSFRAKIL